MNNQLGDPFNELRGITGCDYISDLRFQPYNHIARLYFSQFNLNKYTLKELNDIAQYIFFKEENFKKIDEAKDYFKSFRNR